jgi:hypothetical protein
MMVNKTLFQTSHLHHFHFQTDKHLAAINLSVLLIELSVLLIDLAVLCCIDLDVLCIQSGFATTVAGLSY